MILDIYKDSLEYSAKDWKTLVILGVICLFSFLLLPIFLITGYNYRVINTAVHGIINGRDPLPDFDDIIAMFVDGVKVVIVQMLYMLVPFFIFILFAAISNSLNGVFASAIKGLDCIAIGPALYDVHTTSEKLSISSTQKVYTLLIELLKRCK